MHTVELMEQSIAVAESLGYRIRHEWLGGSGGGACQFGGQKWIFIDLALNTIEQLDQLREALMQDPGVETVSLTPQVQSFLGLKRAA